MIFDLSQIFSNAQAITATARSTNILDTATASTYATTLTAGEGASRIGRGNPVPLRVQVVTAAFTKLTSLRVDVQTDNDVAFGSAATIGSSGEIALASLVVGYQFPIHWIPKAQAERFISLLYTVTGTNPDAGAITAGIVLADQEN
jgi:hypothetical protein